MLFKVNAQELNKGAIHSGSSSTSTARHSIDGWVGTCVNVVTADFRAGSATGISSVGNKTEKLFLEATIFPNPLSEVSALMVKTNDKGYMVQVFDNLGRDVTPGNLSGKTQKDAVLPLQTENWALGVYTIAVTPLNGKTVKAIKVVKSL